MLQYQLDKEKAVLQALEKQYKRALSDILDKTKILQVDIDALDQAIETSDNDAQLLSMKRSKVYQQQYQQALKKQIEAILEKLHSDEYSTIQEYLNGCYADGFIGAAYSLQAQGIPIITPIDQKAAVQAVQLDSKVVEGYYKHLGVDFDNLKKVIPQEVSRGIASSLPYSDIARNLNNASKSGLYNAKRITITEGHRIQQQAAEDNRVAAKKKGADVVRQWDSALDGRTRPSHRRVDGEIRELDEKFSNGLMYAGDPNGAAAEVINCRCVTLTRAKWALDEEELETLKERAEYFGLDKTENFEDYKKKYLKAADDGGKVSKGNTQTVKQPEKATDPNEILKSSDVSELQSKMTDLEKQLNEATDFNEMVRIQEEQDRIAKRISEIRKAQLQEIKKQTISNTQKEILSEGVFKEVDLADCDVEVAKAIQNVAEKFHAKYPDVTLKRLKITEGNMVGEVNKAADSLGKTSGTSMSFNGAYFGRAERLKEQIDSQHESGWAIFDSIDGLVAHEFGHAACNYYGISTFDIAGKVMVDSGLSRNKSYIGKDKELYDSIMHISRYGDTSTDEWFSECFANYLTSDEPEEIAKKAVSVFDEMVSKKKKK